MSLDRQMTYFKGSIYFVAVASILHCHHQGSLNLLHLSVMLVGYEFEPGYMWGENAFFSTRPCDVHLYYRLI